MATFYDQFGISWRGGVKLVAIDSVLPVIILPTIFILAAQSLWWTIFSFSTMAMFLIYISKFLIRITPKTKFFFIWTISSILILYIIFEFIVIPLLEILLEENIALSLLIGAFLYCLYALKIKNNQFKNTQNSNVFTRSGKRFNNCSICQTTVPDKDHHCVWFDTCISDKNQGLFMMSLFFASASLLYSSNLTLTSVCHPFKFYQTILLPDDCSEVYQSVELGISFVSALYSIVLAVVTITLFLQQILLVSIGLTKGEWNKLPFSSKCLLGLTSSKSFKTGFCRNWARIIFGTDYSYRVESQT